MVNLLFLAICLLLTGGCSPLCGKHLSLLRDTILLEDDRIRDTSHTTLMNEKPRFDQLQRMEAEQEGYRLRSDPLALTISPERPRLGIEFSRINKNPIASEEELAAFKRVILQEANSDVSESFPGILCIGDSEEVERFYIAKFEDLQQDLCILTTETFVNLVDPLEQNRYPYTEEDFEGPPWWPKTAGQQCVRYKAPALLSNSGEYSQLGPTSLIITNGFS